PGADAAEVADRIVETLLATSLPAAPQARGFTNTVGRDVASYVSTGATCDPNANFSTSLRTRRRPRRLVPPAACVVVLRKAHRHGSILRLKPALADRSARARAGVPAEIVSMSLAGASPHG